MQLFGAATTDGRLEERKRQQGGFVSPERAGPDDFAWRLSTHVQGVSPFSVYPGIDRSIAVLAGDGLALELPGGLERRLGPGDSPIAFAGEWYVIGRSLGGPSLDANIMTRRGTHSHSMKWTVQHRDAMLRPGFASGLYIPIEPACISYDSDALRMDALDTLWLSPGEGATLRSSRPTPLLVLECLVTANIRAD